MAAATRQLLADWPAEAGVAPVRPRPAPAAPRATQNQPNPARAEPEPSPAQPGGSAPHPRPSAPRALGFSAQPRACAALSAVDSSGRLGDHVPAPAPPGPFSPGTPAGVPHLRPPAFLRRRQRQARGRPRPPAPRPEPPGATSASGEYCVWRCRRGGGRRKEAALRRLRAPHCRIRGREGRCRPAAGPGAGSAPAGRPRTPHPSARVTGPHVPSAASTRLGPGTLAAPATSARPALLGYPAVPPSRRRSPPPGN